MRRVNDTTLQAVRVWWSFAWRVVVLISLFGFITASWAQAFAESSALQQTIKSLDWLAAITVSILAIQVVLCKQYRGFRITFIERDVVHFTAPTTGLVPAGRALKLLLCYPTVVLVALAPLAMVSNAVPATLLTLVSLGIFVLVSSAVGIWAMHRLLTDSHADFEIMLKALDRDATRARHADHLGPPALLH